MRGMSGHMTSQEETLQARLYEWKQVAKVLVVNGCERMSKNGVA